MVRVQTVTAGPLPQASAGGLSLPRTGGSGSGIQLEVGQPETAKKEGQCSFLVHGPGTVPFFVPFYITT